MQAELIADVRCQTGESPVWHQAEQALYWVDIPAGRLHRWRSVDGGLTSWQAPEQLACLALRHGQQGWVAGLESGLFELLSSEAEAHLSTRCLVTVNHALPSMRFNDGRCDRVGRFWAGTMALSPDPDRRPGKLYRYEAGGPLSEVLGGLKVPNGLAFSPDGQTMYLSDSHPSVQCIWAFDYDVDKGAPMNRRLFVDMNLLPGRPDGAAIDVDGGYWICANDAGLVHRFTPAGRLDRSLAVPVRKPTMCAFGGADLRTLFVTSIRPAGVELADQPLAGSVFALRPGVQGMPEPVFAG